MGNLYRCNGWNRCKCGYNDCPARPPHKRDATHVCGRTFACPALKGAHVLCVPVPEVRKAREAC